MKFLLDVNVVIAGSVATHPLNNLAAAWLKDKQVVLCPLIELGFLRITTQPKVAIAADMASARRSLEKFSMERLAFRIHDDLPALDSHPQTSKEVTDYYLAELAAKHGMKFATFDTGIKHPAVELIS